MKLVNYLRRIFGGLFSSVGFIGLFAVSDNFGLWLLSATICSLLIIAGQALLKKEGLV